MTTKFADMTPWECNQMVWELQILTRPWTLKSDTEAQADSERVAEILTIFGEQYPEDVFDRFLS